MTASVQNVFSVSAGQPTRHVVLGGTKALKLSANSVTVDVEHEGFSTEIPFDFCLVATVRPKSTRHGSQLSSDLALFRDPPTRSPAALSTATRPKQMSLRLSQRSRPTSLQPRASLLLVEVQPVLR